MGSSRRQYDKAFKKEVVRLVTEEDRSIAQLARDLGIHENLIYTWRQKFREDPENAFSGKGCLKPQDEEIRRLKRLLEDNTEEVEFKERVNDFTANFGGILHSFSSALSSVEQNINSAISALDNDPFPQGFLPVELADNTLEQPASELVTSLTNLINWVDSPEKEAVFSSSNIKALKELLELLQNYRDKIPAIEFRPSALEEVACDVIDLCKHIRQGSHPGTLIRDTEKKAEELKRITSLIGLRHLKDATIEMDYEVRSVREYITLHEPKKTPSSYFTIGELISGSLTNIANYRGNMGVKVEI
ncbi:MAG: transposase [Chloroflexi bacterium]|nr:transposase [Chloroflexota bacterium]